MAALSLGAQLNFIPPLSAVLVADWEPAAEDETNDEWVIREEGLGKLEVDIEACNDPTNPRCCVLRRVIPSAVSAAAGSGPPKLKRANTARAKSVNEGAVTVDLF